MLTQKEYKRFGLRADPFCGELHNPGPNGDIFPGYNMSLAEVRLWRAIEAPGMAALVGDVGTGKTVLLAKLMHEWEQSNKRRLIQVYSIARRKYTSSQLASAILRDLTGKNIYASMEDKGHMIAQVFRAAAKRNERPILIIDEAHELPTGVLRDIKKIYEVSGKFNVNLAVLLAGQTLLERRLRDEVDLKEVLDRIEIVRLDGVGQEGRDYLAYKLKRVGGDIDRIFTPEALTLLFQAAQTPLGINNLAETAMRVCRKVREARIDAEVMAKAFHANSLEIATDAEDVEEEAEAAPRRRVAS